MGKYGKEFLGSFEGKAGTVIGSNWRGVAYVPFVVILISFFIPHVTTQRRNKDEATTAQQTRHQPSIPVNFRHNLVGSLWATMFEPMKQGCLIISPKLEVLSLKCKSWTCCHVKGDGFRAWPDFSRWSKRQQHLRAHFKRNRRKAKSQSEMNPRRPTCSPVLGELSAGLRGKTKKLKSES